MARIEYQIVKVIALASLLVSARLLPASEGDPFPPSDLTEETLVYVGSQAKGEWQGIHAFWLQTKNLAVSQNITLVPIGIAAETPQVTYLELDSKRRLVFALSAADEFEGQLGGSVAAFSVDAASGKLNRINRQPSMGARPCHLAAVFPIGPDGSLGAATQVVSTGSADSSDSAQTACVALYPENRFGFACETGLGKVFAYRYDAERGALAPGEPPSIDAEEGSGPRRLLFRRIDDGNGRLKPSGLFAAVPSPTIVRFLPPVE